LAAGIERVILPGGRRAVCGGCVRGLARLAVPLPHHGPLPCPAPRRMTIFPGMFCVSESEAAAIRTAYEQGGELSAAIELRRLFPGITDNAKARACARTIAG
jgi:hypothetical protein